MEPIKDKRGRIIVNRDTCVYCDRFKWCKYMLWAGKPADCPKADEQEAK